MYIDKFIEEIEIGLKILFSPSLSNRPRPDKKISNKVNLSSAIKKKNSKLMSRRKFQYKS